MNMSTMNPRPTLVTALAVMTLLSGIVNVFWGLIASLTVMATIIGVICTPLTILPTILGIFEILYAAKLLSTPVQPVRPSINIAALEIACILAGNVFSMVVGILALVFYNDLIVKAYFEALNAGDVIPGPAVPAPALPETESAEPAPAAPETPADPGEAEGQTPPPAPGEAA